MNTQNTNRSRNMIKNIFSSINKYNTKVWEETNKKAKAFRLRFSVLGHLSSFIRLQTSDTKYQTPNTQHQPSVTHQPSIKKSHRLIALTLILSILQPLIPYNSLLANNNGPNAPEAGSFEPVDATDMVDLGTGDLSYVLPLMNVPSPEGGYPISLTYHAGISMDQEASWVGLGWNINPGSINRNINGYPDDWREGQFTEYYYDTGGQETFYNASIGYTSFTAGGSSIGLSLSWGDNRALTGAVSFGFGIPVGEGNIGINGSVSTNGNSSISVGYTSPSGVSFGVSAGTQGVGINTGYSWGENGSKSGLNFGASMPYGGGNNSYSLSYSKGETGKKNSIGINFSSQHIGLNIGIEGVGTGVSFGFSKSISMNDYTTSQSGGNVPLFFPTGEGMITLSFGKQTIRYYLDQRKINMVSGVIHGNAVTNTNSFMDIYEVDIANNAKNIDLRNGNVTLPNYDTYRVSAQGLSGSISPRVFENVSLVGLNKEISGEYTVGSINFDNRFTASIHKFNKKVNYYFNGENSTSLLVNKIIHNNSNTPINPASFINNGLPNVDITYPNKKTGNFIEYFTNAELSNSSFVASKQILDYNVVLRSLLDPDGIGGYRITTPDGKTYNYMLPVYNHEIVHRQLGIVGDDKSESQAFFENRQVKSYATHWLLTSITGPDFVKNGSGFTGTDFGYWVAFEYGKWSNGYAWKTPKNKTYKINENNPSIKSYTWGRKDIYYLDLIRTRTHTALFVKENREDNKGASINTFTQLRKPSALEPFIGRQDHPSKRNLEIKSQSTLRLKEILLVRNEDLQNSELFEYGEVSKKNKISFPSQPPKDENGSLPWFEKKKSINYSIQDKVLDIGDLNNNEWGYIKDRSIKSVDFSKHYSYSLSKASNRAIYGKLTLNGLTFRGQNGNEYMPAYKFSYKDDNTLLDWSKKSDWGYYAGNESVWSLNKITNPTGATTEIKYETDEFNVITDYNYINLKNSKRGADKNNKYRYDIQRIGNELAGELKAKNVKKLQFLVTINNPYFKVLVGDKLDLKYYEKEYNSTTINFDAIKRRFEWGLGKYKGNRPLKDDSNKWMYYDGEAIIKEITLDSPSKVQFIVENTGLFSRTLENKTAKSFDLFYHREALVDLDILAKYKLNRKNDGGGIRVKEIKTTGGGLVNSITYNYNKPGTPETSGVMSYIPFSQNIITEIPYGSQLPAPIPFYEYVTVSNNQQKTTYTFEVLPRKEEGKIKFGDIIEYDCYQDVNYNKRYNKLIPNPIIPDHSISVEINTNEKLKGVTFNDNKAALGRLLSTSSYNKAGQLINKTVNTYKSLNEINQGIVQESFQQYKFINYNNSNNVFDRQYNSSTHKIYPSVLESTTVTQGGITSTTTFGEHDPNTGLVQETITENSNGTILKTKTVPAYTKYPKMGSKVENLSNKNMLTQNAINYSFLKENDSWKVINANITTWNDEWDYFRRKYNPQPQIEYEIVPFNDPNGKFKVWRKHKTYSWKGDIDRKGVLKNFDITSDGGFNWSSNTANQPSTWQKTSEIKYYDKYSMPIEVKDINNNSASTLMGNNQTYTIATTNAPLHEMFYTGLEYPSDWNWVGNSGITSQKAHTGNFSKEVDVNVEAFKFHFNLNPNRQGKYKISVWVHKDNHDNARVNVGGGLVKFNGEIIPAGNWVLHNHYFDSKTIANNIYITSASGKILLDDFRIHPLESTMTSYVYNDQGQLTYILGGNNLATHYQYNEAGLLCLTFSEIVDNASIIGGFKLNSKNSINYNGAYSRECGSPNSSIVATLKDITDEGKIHDRKFKLGVFSNSEIKNWELVHSYGLLNKKIASGTGAPPKIVEHKFGNFPGVPENSTKTILILNVTDVNNKIGTTKISLLKNYNTRKLSLVKGEGTISRGGAGQSISASGTLRAPEGTTINFYTTVSGIGSSRVTVNGIRANAYISNSESTKKSDIKSFVMPYSGTVSVNLTGERPANYSPAPNVPTLIISSELGDEVWNLFNWDTNGPNNN